MGVHISGFCTEKSENIGCTKTLQDHPYVLRRLRETLQETQQDGIRLWDITQSPAPHTHTLSPPHKRRRTDTGGTHSTPGALRTTHHDAPDPPASGAAT